MKRNAAYAKYVITIWLVLARVSTAQVATGAPKFGSFGGGSVDTINLGNLNVHVAVPMIHKAGRGMPFTYDLSFDNSVWSPVLVNGVNTWQPDLNWGWRGQTEVTTGYVSFTTTRTTCPNPDYPPALPKTFTDFVFSNYVYHDPFGVQHLFHIFYDPGPCSQDPPVTATATDVSVYSIAVSELYGKTVAVTSRSCVTIIAPVLSGSGVCTRTDANGNQITVNSSGHFFDTLSSAT